MMSASFMDLFDIKEVFEQNSRQRILMGTPKNAPGDVVVLNRFYQDETFNNDMSVLLKRSLKNLIHIENAQNELVVVTLYPEGASLTALLDSTKLLPQDRLRLAELYLDTLPSYDILPPALQFLLVDLNQYVVQETGLEPKELILLDRNFNPAMTAEPVAKKISAALETILKPDTIAYEEWISDGIKNIITGLSVGAIATFSAARGTFAGLLASNDRLADLSKVNPSTGTAVVQDDPFDSETDATSEEDSSAFGSVAGAAALTAAATGTTDAAYAGTSGAKHLGMDPTRMIELENLFVENERPLRADTIKRKSVKRRNFKWIAWILLIAVSALVLFGIFNLLTGLFIRKAPIARFETEKDNNAYHFLNSSTVSGQDNKLTQIQWTIDKDDTELLTSDEFDLLVTFKNPGKYKITLLVKDRYRWSNAYSQVIEHDGSPSEPATSGEGGPNTGISGGADDPLSGITASVISDNLTIDGTESHNGTKSLKLDMTGSDQAQMTLNGLTVNKSTALSFWMRSDTTDRVLLTVFGYDSNGLRFTKKLTISPKSTSNWEMVTIQSNYNDISSMKLQFSAPGSILWLDDFDLAAFK